MESWPQNISQFKIWARHNLGTRLFLHYIQRKAVRRVVTIVNVNHSSVHFLDAMGELYKVPYPKKGHYKFTKDWFSLKTMVFKYVLPGEEQKIEEEVVPEKQPVAPVAPPVEKAPEPVTDPPAREVIFEKRVIEVTSDLFQQLWGLAQMHGFQEGMDSIQLPQQNKEFLDRLAESISGEVKQYPSPPGLILGIPMYGLLTAEDLAIEDVRNTRASTWNEYYIARGLDILAPGGLLVLLLRADPARGETLFLHSGQGACKQSINRRTKILDAYRLPSSEYDGKMLKQEVVVMRKEILL